MLYKKFATKSFITKAVIVSSIATALIVPVAQALAWCTEQSASVSCVNGADIHVSFSNTETDKNMAMNVVAKDNQTGQSIDLGKIDAQQTKSGDIATGKSTINSGNVTFYLTWANGQSGSDTRNEGYSAVTCQMPTPTQQPSPTVTPTSIPSATPTNEPSPTPTPTCEETTTPTVTPEVTETPTVTPTAGPTATPTAGPTPTPIVVTATPAPTNTITVVVQSSTATAPTVQPAPKTQELPKTGAETDVLFGLLSLLPVGLKLRKMK